MNISVITGICSPNDNMPQVIQISQQTTNVLAAGLHILMLIPKRKELECFINEVQKVYFKILNPAQVHFSKMFEYILLSRLCRYVILKIWISEFISWKFFINVHRFHFIKFQQTYRHQNLFENYVIKHQHNFSIITWWKYI